MKVSLLIALAAFVVLVAAQESNQRSRSRLRALTEAARNGDPEARAKLIRIRDQRKRLREKGGETINRRRPGGSRGGQVPVRRVRPVPTAAPTTTQPPTTTTTTTERIQETFVPVFTSTALPETFAPETFIPTTERVQLRTEPRSFTNAPLRRPTVRVRTQELESLDNTFELEPHRALNSGLEVDTRSERFNPVLRDPKQKPREPIVETIRRYSYFDTDGSYVFGYEAADGSFKEERRRLDCVVEGKYGYVDPDGVRREFNYISGNQCDPNAPADPELASPLPLNDQFMHQTAEKKLTQEELQGLQFQRRRNQPKQPLDEAPQRKAPTSQRRPVPTPVPQQPPKRFRPVPTNVPQQPPKRFRPVPVITEPTPVEVTTPKASTNRFTTPASFKKFKNPSIQEEGPTRKPSVFQAPVNPQRNILKPEPVNFDFNQEFPSIFSNFPGSGTRVKTRPAPRVESRPAPRPTPKPTTRPTTARPTARPPPPPSPQFVNPSVHQIAQSHFAPASFQNPSRTTSVPKSKKPKQPFVDSAFTLTSQPEAPKLLVFDEKTRGFKTVKGVPKSSPPAVRPFPSAAPSPAVRPFPAATPSPASRNTGIPLIKSNPLPTIPKSTADFDSFFKQFKLTFN